ncbi:MAG: thiolase family protein [Deltaproteobacteria bacterium]|nr:thiolase family protein [Deltaproteobacteria bacterium]
MPLTKAFIPYGAYWSTPFCRWQGSLAGVSALKLLGDVAPKALKARGIAPDVFDGLVLGWTVPQKHFFYGAPWVAGMIGAPGIAGQMVAQACATSARALCNAALEVETGLKACLLAVCCDRTSNGPHLYYPNPAGPGGMGEAENPVWDNFGFDPWGKTAMVQTAEAVAKKTGITRAQQDEITVLRYQQYADSLADDRAFQKRYVFPVELQKSRTETLTVAEDEGIFPTTAEGLARLKPVSEGGTVTFGSQTHPADGNAGMVVCTEERARTLSRDPKVNVRLVAFGDARVEKGCMPMATVPAARLALERAGIGPRDLRVAKTHNPFALNDVYFCRELGLAPEAVNNNGSPLVYGHPQAPVGIRIVAEMIEELQMRGGGYGLFSGCAAGDTSMAVVVKVG